MMAEIWILERRRQPAKTQMAHELIANSYWLFVLRHQLGSVFWAVFLFTLLYPQNRAILKAEEYETPLEIPILTGRDKI